MPRINNKKFYTSSIKRYGTTPKGVNWCSKDTQFIRFKAILEMLPKDLSIFSIVDAGCGFGDFHTYLSNKKRVPQNYIGIDSLSEMYSIASSNTACEILIADICKDEIPDASYYVCSGALNILTSFETNLFIKRCYDSCSYGFIFNILHGDKKSDTYNYLTTDAINEIANVLKVKKVKLNTSYLKDDITVGFFK